MMIILRLGARVLFNRAGFVIIVFALLWGWHVYDKQQAVKAARKGYVQAFELTAVRTELDALLRRAAAAKQANRSLQEKVRIAEREALFFATELEAYESETQINPEGIVDIDLLRRLRAN